MAPTTRTTAAAIAPMRMPTWAEVVEAVRVRAVQLRGAGGAKHLGCWMPNMPAVVGCLQGCKVGWAGPLAAGVAAGQAVRSERRQICW